MTSTSFCSTIARDPAFEFMFEGKLIVIGYFFPLLDIPLTHNDSTLQIFVGVLAAHNLSNAVWIAAVIDISSIATPESCVDD